MNDNDSELKYVTQRAALGYSLSLAGFVGGVLSFHQLTSHAEKPPNQREIQRIDQDIRELRQQLANLARTRARKTSSGLTVCAPAETPPQSVSAARSRPALPGDS